ncbi:MAG: hypothetical protein KDA62_21860, partial [Planctomycetales bacterium]|nr:hypothetical protein [Planctomycetales bacterium]
SSGALKHGIWTHHVIEALAGRAPTALVKGVHLTSSSLQNYLKREVPRTLTKTFATKKVQTPWMAGASDGEFRIADLTDVLAKRKAAANPHAGQIKNVTLLTQRTKGVRSLSGFKKNHKEPDRVSSATEAFVARISSEGITEDINGVFAQLKSAFRFRRADMHLTNHGDGTATIITPFFNYSITVQLDPEDTSQVIFRRTVEAIKEPDQVFSDEFAKVFDGVFDTVEFDTPGFVDLPALIDRIEELDDDRISIDYDPEVTHCTLHIDGVVGSITVTSGSLSIIHTKPQSPKNLLQSFFGIQRVLFDQHDVRLIPFDDKAENKSS